MWTDPRDPYCLTVFWSPSPHLQRGGKERSWIPESLLIRELSGCSAAIGIGLQIGWQGLAGGTGLCSQAACQSLKSSLLEDSLRLETAHSFSGLWSQASSKSFKWVCMHAQTHTHKHKIQCYGSTHVHSPLPESWQSCHSPSHSLMCSPGGERSQGPIHSCNCTRVYCIPLILCVDAPTVSHDIFYCEKCPSLNKLNSQVSFFPQALFKI